MSFLLGFLLLQRSDLYAQLVCAALSFKSFCHCLYGLCGQLQVLVRLQTDTIHL